MWELLGLSANVPTDIRLSFSTLMQRGGRTGPHKDGWGISLNEGRGAHWLKRWPGNWRRLAASTCCSPMRRTCTPVAKPICTG